MMYVVHVSGGLTSFEALRRTIEKYGRDNTRAIFADVKGESECEHDGEDADLYRFLDDIERVLDVAITRLREGRTVWQVLYDERCITLNVGGRTVAPCSKFLKRGVLDRYIRETFAGQDITHVFGMDWTEQHRVDDLRAVCAPTLTWFPLTEPPFVDKCHIERILAGLGVRVPRLYEEGFSHNNCGGFCTRAGQAHFANLYRRRPDRYLYHEGKEQGIREYLDKDIAILRDRRGGVSRPMTLREFRERLERGEAYDKEEWGGCGCFAPVGQLRMDDLLLEADIAHKPARRLRRIKREVNA